MPEHCLRSRLLLWAQVSTKAHIQWFSVAPLITNYRLDLQRLKQFLNILKTASWQGIMLRVILGATDDSRFVVGREAHRLCSIKFGVLKRGNAKKPVAKRRREVLLGDVDLIRENQFHFLRQRAGNG
jgi:hypothetical protein